MDKIVINNNYDYDYFHNIAQQQTKQDKPCAVYEHSILQIVQPKINMNLTWIHTI